MAWQSFPNILLVSILLVAVPHGLADQETSNATVGNSNRDEVTKDMYHSLMERLERQEASIEQLQTAVADKDKRIKMLEHDLQEIKIEVQQRQQLSDSETFPKHVKNVPQFSSNRKQDGNFKEANHPTNPAFYNKKAQMVNRQRRVSTSGVAFSTTMQNDATVHKQETLIFGHVLLNEGSGYNSGDGIYTVPQSGVYVFTWSITSETNTGGDHDIHTSLMHNGSPIGAIDADADERNWGSATGVVVVSVVMGDHVYITVSGGAGVIISNPNAKSTFSGWLLF